MIHKCTNCQHSFISQQYRSGGSGGGTDSYEGQYELIDSAIPLRPLKTTHKPVVQGPQTAFVVGKDGEEIDCDEYGRILVRFHWDRENDQSMRCRVAQNWAYKQWGGMIIPRIGMEVMVEFLDGDPDRPLVTGSVYNGDAMPPYTLPLFKTRSTFKSNTHKGSGYNEIRFEDETEEEEIYVQAERYLNGFIKKDETWLVEGARHRRVESSQSESIGGDKDMELKGDHREHVRGSRDFIIEGSRTGQIDICDYLKVAGHSVKEIERSADTYIHEHYRLETQGAHHTKTGTTHFIDAGDTLVLSAGSAISLNVGGNFIRINQSGVQIEGTMVNVNCGGSPTAGKEIRKQDVLKPKKYSGPHAKRYARSFKS